MDPVSIIDRVGLANNDNKYVIVSCLILKVEIAMKVISGLFPGVTTVELDNLAAETAATMTTRHPDYAVLAARIVVSNLHKETKKIFTGISFILIRFLNFFLCMKNTTYFYTFFFFRCN